MNRRDELLKRVREDAEAVAKLTSGAMNIACVYRETSSVLISGESRLTSAPMLALLCFILALLASPFKSKSRLTELAARKFNKIEEHLFRGEHFVRAGATSKEATRHGTTHTCLLCAGSRAKAEQSYGFVAAIWIIFGSGIDAFSRRTDFGESWRAAGPQSAHQPATELVPCAASARVRCQHPDRDG
jgi:hypothetical protein